MPPAGIKAEFGNPALEVAATVIGLEGFGSVIPKSPLFTVRSD